MDSTTIWNFCVPLAALSRLWKLFVWIVLWKSIPMWNTFSPGCRTCYTTISFRRNQDVEVYEQYEVVLSWDFVIETQDMKNRYNALLSQIKSICSQCEDNQVGLPTGTDPSSVFKLDHLLYRKLFKLRRRARKVGREIKQVMNDEECGYTVNRESE